MRVENRTVADQKSEPANSTKGQHKSYQDLPRSWTIVEDHPTDLIISDVSKGVKTRSQAHSEFSHLVFLSQIEPKRVDDALEEFWLLVMHDELNNFDRNNIWELVPRPQKLFYRWY